ncbi:MAG: PP2C family protein-serine/threonine phosphatase, partial [Pseudomonadota bacterium]
PASRAGGDYYDFFLDARGRQVVTVADVSGHGASAAVLMGMLRALLKVLVAKGDTASEVMVLLNQALLENIGDDPDFISILIGLIDENRRRLNFCSAGHGHMLLMGPAKGELRSLPSGGTVLGCFEATWNDDFVDLSPNQSLVLYTDGLIEVANEEGEEFGRRRLEELLRKVDPVENPAELVERIRTEVTEFAEGAIFPDDLTLFIIKFK